MPTNGFGAAEKVGFGGVEARCRLGWWLEQTLDIGVQRGLIGFDLPDILTPGFDDLNGQVALGKGSIAGYELTLQIKHFQQPRGYAELAFTCGQFYLHQHDPSTRDIRPQ